MFIHPDWKYDISIPSKTLREAYNLATEEFSSNKYDSFNQMNEALFEEYTKTHDQKIRDEIIIRNIRLVFNKVKRFQSSDVAIDGDDIVQIGMIGLIYAADTYRYPCDASFSTYASLCIQSQILKMYRKFNTFNKYISMYTPLPENPEITVGDMIEDPFEPIEITTEDIAVVQYLDKYNKWFSERDLEVVKYYIGLGEYESHSYKETGDKFGMTGSRVGQIIKRVMMYIRVKKVKYA